MRCLQFQCMILSTTQTIGWGCHSSLWPVPVACCPSHFWCHSLVFCCTVYIFYFICMVMYTTMCKQISWQICITFFALNYAHFQPVIYVFIVLYSNIRNELRPLLSTLIYPHNTWQNKLHYTTGPAGTVAWVSVTSTCHWICRFLVLQVEPLSSCAFEDRKSRTKTNPQK